MSQLTITCPSCNETFSADQALQNHLKSKEKKYQESINKYESILKKNPNFVPAMNNVGLAYEYLGLLDKDNRPTNITKATVYSQDVNT